MAQLVSAVSQVMTLLPGDVIASGTPSGVGPMQPGDIVEVRIEGIGTLSNRVSRQNSAQFLLVKIPAHIGPGKVDYREDSYRGSDRQ